MLEQEFNMANALAVAFESKAKMVQMFTRDYNNETNIKIEKQLDTLDVQIKQMLSLCEREVALQEKHLELMSQADEDEHHCHCGGNCHGIKRELITLPDGTELYYMPPTVDTVSEFFRNTKLNLSQHVLAELAGVFNKLSCFTDEDGNPIALMWKQFVK